MVNEWRMQCHYVYFVLFSANAAESDKRDLMKELHTMKQLKEHPHVMKLLGCVSDSGERNRAIAHHLHVY